MSSPSTKTIKKLSILSGNLCAFPKCPIPLVDKDNDSITAQICHIKAKNPGGPRYDPNQTDEERDAFENLILMCPVHHKVIDDDVESYTVERLHQIKANHEARVSATPEAFLEQGTIEKLLESYLISLIEKGNFQVDNTKKLKEENSYLVKAQRLAREKEHNTFRELWAFSNEGLNDTINSINHIFSLFDTHFSSNSEMFASLQIEIHKEKGCRVVATSYIGSQITLKGFQAHSYNNSPRNISFEIILFKKKPRGDGFFIGEPITFLHLVPDIDPAKQVIWKDKDRESRIYSAEEVSEICFDLLINQLEKNEPVESSGYIYDDYKEDEEDEYGW